MSLTRNPFRSLVASLAIVLTLGLLSVAQVSAKTEKTANSATANVHIKNFGQMDDRFFRGAQPKEEDFKDLKAIGVQTVIDLRDDPVSYEKSAVEALGMRYVNIPMSDSSYPKEEQIQQFLKLVDDPATGKFYVHCAGGRHRTGVMGAVYRYNYYHWNFDQVYKEMKDYDFYTRFGHGDLKKYVEDYWQHIQAKSVASNVAAPATQGN
ncbi:MAG TPA: tyrosine-protein phosphatase [Pyrinomonadaceae bacterium]|nr:tyrosine-protein phosphatase [Pyrinomonadaceae bacterium]